MARRWSDPSAAARSVAALDEDVQTVTAVSEERRGRRSKVRRLDARILRSQKPAGWVSRPAAVSSTKPDTNKQPYDARHRVLAALAVADVDSATGWYERLLGRPADALPMDGLAEWHFPPSGAIQLVQDADRAGRSLLTFGVDDLKEELVILRANGPRSRRDARHDLRQSAVRDSDGHDGNAIRVRSSSSGISASW
jgi:hypothetical protein